MTNLNKNIEEGLFEFCLNADKVSIHDAISDIEDRKKTDILFEEKLIRKMQFISNASLKKQKDESHLEQILFKFQDDISQNFKKSLSELKDLIITGKLGLQFRNLDSLTEEDIKDIIRDKNLIDLLEKLDNESQNED